jgi:hypothetical protein
MMFGAPGESIPDRLLEPLPEWPGLYRPIKKPVTLRLDADVLAWFKRQGRPAQVDDGRAEERREEERRAEEIGGMS